MRIETKKNWETNVNNLAFTFIDLQTFHSLNIIVRQTVDILGLDNHFKGYLLLGDIKNAWKISFSTFKHTYTIKRRIEQKIRKLAAKY